MSAERLEEYLDHMERAARDACTYAEGYDRADFMDDRRTQQAIVMNLVILGEAAGRIMDRHPEFAEHHPAIAWRGMRGMRNRIAHGYFEINLDLVWETVRSALPELLSQLEAARKSL